VLAPKSERAGRRPLSSTRPRAAAVITVLVALLATPTLAHADAPARAYELVSPADKHATDVLTTVAATADGDAVVYDSFGTLADSPNAVFGTFYRSSRTATGWTTATLSPNPVVRSPSLASSILPLDFSTDLRTMYGVALNAVLPMVPEDQNTLVDVYAFTGGGQSTWLSPGAGDGPGATGDSHYAGRSDDGRHIVFESSKQMLPDVPGGTNEVYERVDGHVRLVSAIDDQGTPAPTDATYGSGRAWIPSSTPGDRRAMSTDGSHIFFNADTQLYVRIDGTTTKRISTSRVTGQVGDPAPDGAEFVSASEDGERVIFTSRSPLLDSATGPALYRYDLRDDTLRLLTDTDTYYGGVSRIAHDASRVYFGTIMQIGGQGELGANNLFVVGDDGVPRLVATLGPGDLGTIFGQAENNNVAAISRDGLRLAFASPAQLTAYDNQGMSEVYVYDDGTRAVTCTSCPSDGAAPVGNATLRNGSGNDPLLARPRTLTDDGGVFFETPQPLVAADDDDKIDVYEVKDDSPHLMSPDTKTDAHFVDATPDASTVFVQTRDALAPADIDGGYSDVYAWRVGGGFPVVTSPSCSGAACRGPQAADPSSSAPGTETALDTAPGKPTAAAVTLRVSKIGSAAVRTFARTGKLRVRVRVSGTAVVTASGRGQIGKRTVTVAAGATNRAGTGAVTLAVRLTTAARKALTASGRLTVRLRFSAGAGTHPAHATVVLRKSRKAGR
jgi:hypothetical protein